MTVGRYDLYDELGAGGMATVYLARTRGAAGFSRAVAIKRLHPHFAGDPEFVRMLVDEARLAVRIRHPNVVGTLDVISTGSELAIVMDYILGETLFSLARAMSREGERIPPAIAGSIVLGALEGLHAAHEATNTNGTPLEIVHRDVSPQNLLVGADGVTRVLDFGVAKASVRLQTTREGQFKGKLRYTPPEVLRGQPASRRADVYAAAVVLWETLTGRNLFAGDTEGEVYGKVLEGVVQPASRYVRGLPSAVDDVLRLGLERDPDRRFASARDMAVALEAALEAARPRDVAAWIEHVCGATLGARAKQLAEIEDVSGLPTSTHVRTSALAMSPAPDAALVASAPLATRPRMRSLRALAVAAVTLAVGGALAYALYARTTANDSLQSDAVSAAAQGRGADPAPRAVADESRPEPLVRPTSSFDAPLPSFIGSGNTASIPTSRPTRTRARSPAPARPAPPQSCEPPTVLDDAGIERIRPGCENK
jgi:serine/threonine-protein kinase